VSKRHHNSRRKAYGRRQHELRERADRGQVPDALELRDGPADGGGHDRYSFLDTRMPSLRYALGE